MNEEKPSRIFELFEQACSLDDEARSKLLTDVEADDPALAAELRGLLAADSGEGKVPVDPESRPVPTSIVASALGGLESDDASVESALKGLSSTPSTDRYEVGEEIGRGAMGLVSRTWDRVLQRQLATKTLRTDRQPGARATAPAIVRFLQEARVTGRLEHPGIVPVHDLGIDEHGRAFFTMRCVDGLDLQSVFLHAEQGAPEWTRPRLLGVLQRVCEAMSFAHASGVLHRDLKPANIMVGRFGEVYVMDWGVAKVQGKDACDVRVDPESLERESTDASPLRSRAGTAIGTPAYMPPEQAMGDRDDLAPHSDVYSIGAILYQLLTSRVPYVAPGESVPARIVLERLLAGPPPSVAELAPDTPPELIAICERAMARQPADRYPDMVAMAEDLRAYLENRVVSAYESGAWAEAKKWIRRNRSLAGLILLLLLSIFAGLGSYSYVEAQSRQALSEKNVSLAAERDKANSIKLFLTEMLSSANPSKGKRADLMVRDVLEQMGDQVERDLAGQPEIRAELHQVLAAAYRHLELLEPSVEHKRHALEIYRELEPSGSAVQARLMIDVADGGAFLEHTDGELKDDIRIVEEGLAMAKRLKGDHQELIATGESTLGALLAKFDGSIEQTFEQGALLVFEVNDRKYPLEEVRQWLRELPVKMAAAWDAGNTEEAVKILWDERVEDRIRHPIWGPQVPEAVMRYAEWLELQDLTSAAAAVRFVAYRMADDVWSGNSLRLARWRLREAGEAAERERLEDARQLVLLALDVLRDSFGPSDSHTIDALLELSDIEERRGDLPAARRVLTDGLELVRADLPAWHSNYVRVVIAAGEMELRRGDAPVARRLYLECLPALTEKEGESGSQHLAALHLAMGRCWRALSDDDSAESSFLAALAWAEANSDPALHRDAGDELIQLYLARGQARELSDLRQRLAEQD